MSAFNKTSVCLPNSVGVICPNCFHLHIESNELHEGSLYVCPDCRQEFVLHKDNLKFLESDMLVKTTNQSVNEQEKKYKNENGLPSLHVCEINGTLSKIQTMNWFVCLILMAAIAIVCGVVASDVINGILGLVISGVVLMPATFIANAIFNWMKYVAETMSNIQNHSDGN